MEQNKNRRRVALCLSFVIPFFVMLMIFAVNGIYPFGDRSFLFSDMYHQYMPFFSEFMRKIRAGEGLAYSYNVGIGSNFLALYVYYLASPFHWFAFLFPQEHLMEFMSYLVILKIGLCGVTACLYLQKHFQTDRAVTALFSCFYALCGFMAAYNWDIMWLDCCILLPLIMLGLERLIKEGKWGLYCISLSLSILTNYYISIMICIFLVFYFLVLLLMEKGPGGKLSFRTIGRFAIFSLLAGGMAAALLLPEVFAILETDFGDMDFPETLKSYFSILDVLARHAMCISTERGLDHWPNIYCGVAVFMLIPMYVCNDKISVKRKFGYLALAGIFLVSFSLNMLDFIWHGMNYPDSLPARQSFIYSMLVIAMSFGAFLKVEEVSPKSILYGYLAGMAFLLFSDKFVENPDFETGVLYLSMGFLTAYAVLLYLYRVKKSSMWQETLAVAAFGVVVIELVLNTYNTSVGTTSRSQYLDELPDYQSLYEQAKELALEESGEEGSPFFRVEKFERKTKNDGTLAGYPTASVFSSTMNSYVMDLYKRLGMRYSKVYYGYDGATFLTSALLNVKFMFGEGETEEGPLYTLVGESGNISLYEAEETLPFGYTLPEGYDIPSGYSNQALKLQNHLASDLGADSDLFLKAESVKQGENVKFTAGEDGYYYGILTASGTKKVKAVSGDRTRNYSDLKNGCILYLGYLEAGESMTLSNGDEEDDTPEISVDIYRMDASVLHQVMESLGQEHLTALSYDTTHLSGSITLSESKRLVLSIPYEKGWAATVDGKEVEPELFGGTLICFNLEAGTHEITLHYIPHGKYGGILISVVSIGLFAGICLWTKKKHRGGNENEPEDEKAEECALESEEPESSNKR